MAGIGHKISYKSEDYEDVETSLSVSDDEILEIRPNLKRKPAYLSCAVTNRYAQVFVDDVLIGEAPIKNYRLESGSRRISITCSDCISVTEEFNIKAFAHLKLNKTLEKAPVERMPSSQNPRWLSEVFDKRVETSLQLAMGYKGASFKGDPSGQYLSGSIGVQVIYGSIGIEGNFAYNHTLKDKEYDANYNSQTIDASGTTVWGAFNIYLRDPGLYLSFGAGSEETAASKKCSSSAELYYDCVATPEINVSQNFTSIGLGLQGQGAEARYFLKGEIRQYSSGSGVLGLSTLYVSLGVGF